MILWYMQIKIIATKNKCQVWTYNLRFQSPSFGTKTSEPVFPPSDSKLASVAYRARIALSLRRNSTCIVTPVKSNKNVNKKTSDDDNNEERQRRRRRKRRRGRRGKRIERASIMAPRRERAKLTIYLGLLSCGPRQSRPLYQD